MALQDLTPQLRTRLSRVERAVGWFIIIATVVLIAGFAYYLRQRSETNGWFDTKVRYCTGLNSATGLKVGDQVKLMGFNAGEITAIKPNDPSDVYYGVTVYFWIKASKEINCFGYIWLDSRIRVDPSDFLGNRYLEIVKGHNGEPTARTSTNGEVTVLIHDVVRDEFKKITAEITAKDKKAEEDGKEDSEYNPHTVAMEATNALNAIIKEQPERFYTNYTKAKPYWVPPLESPALTERLEALVSTVETALPNFLKLTNQVSGLLTNASGAAATAQATMINAQTVVSNLNVITANLRDPHGSLGEWLIPTNLHAQLDTTVSNANLTLISAHATLDSADTNLTMLAASLDQSLNNLANLTSNLNTQVAANTNLIKNISDAIVHTDGLVEGLKHHWLLRSAFKTKKTNQVDKVNGNPGAVVSPKAK